MSGIRWLLAVLRDLILGNTLVRASTRGLLWLLAALWRAAKRKPPPGSTFADDSRLVHHQTADHEDENAGYSTVPADTENSVGYISASSMPASLQPYLSSGPCGSQASENITTHSMTQESHPLRNFSEHRPGTSSVPHLPPLTPAQDLQVGPGGSPPSTKSSVVDHPLPGTDSPSHSRRSSGVHGDAAVEPPPCLSKAHPHISPAHCTFQRVFTDADLFDPATVVFINDNIRTVNDFVRAHNVDLPPGVDLVLHESIFADEIKGCLYYFVNHLNRCVFWIDNVGSELFLVTPDVRDMTSPSHCRHELEAQYWLHCAYYPRAFELTHEILYELRNIVLHAAGDVLAFSDTPVSWKLHELRDMFAFIAHSDENVGKHTENQFEGYSCFVSRLMHSFACYRSHGEPVARLIEKQSVHGTVQNRTMFIRLLNPLLFNAPGANLFRLHAATTGQLVNCRAWEQLVQRLVSEWQESIINAAVILNANVAFLSIQSVDQGGNIVSARSPAQIASYVSILTSIASTALGLLLSNLYRNRDTKSTAPSPPSTNHTQLMRSLEVLAVLHSGPYAMLVWSILSFFVAFFFIL
ncbi:hypothetical protein MSAN_01138800 [Mycena sanguinolenta]|uniref:Uncharacterized protein n=1 Tax=Mycena sanguinolenta TaxID=230812 RepID=A0A8H7D6X3_9AGAR|nr:hypothetical protein MSAN_01138800 [Mycena sanguinolenta]